MTDNAHETGLPSPMEGEGQAAEQTVAEIEEPIAVSEHDGLGGVTPENLGLSIPDDPHEANELLLRELDEARQESGELLLNLQRLAAEFDNYRKRTERDQLENVQRASQHVVESLLPILDSLDAALTIEATTETEEKMLDGMRGTHIQLLEALASEGLERVDALGTPFDPAVHEAAQVIPGEGDQVVEQELRKGYVMRGRVIRPSLVIVGYA